MASSSLTPIPTPTIIDTAPALGAFVQSIGPSNSLYIDLEGNDLSDLSCPGNISLITILVHPENKISIIDVRTMRHSTFMPLVPPSCGQINKRYVGLKSIFENPTIPKYLWGVRKDAHALKALYDVGFAGVTDLQLLENAARFADKTYMHPRGLQACVEHDAGLSHQDATRWAETMRPGWGWMGLDMFSVRPLRPMTLDYCVGDVMYLPKLREVYMQKMNKLPDSWLLYRLLKAKSAGRIREAHAPGCEPNGRARALLPEARSLGKVRDFAGGFWVLTKTK